MVVDINPVLVSFGPLAVRWFGGLALAGLALAIGLSLRELGQATPDRKAAAAALAWALPAGLLGARLAHVIGYWDYYLTNSEAIWQLNVDGLSLWGGLAVGGLVAATRLRQETVARRRILDVIVPYAALGIVVGRLGEFLDGHGQGLVSALPWATQYANQFAATPDFGVARHPAQLYDALVALGLFALIKLLPSSAPHGARLATFLVVYGLGRLLIGQVRLDPAFLFGLQIEQLLALISVALGVVYGLRAVLRTSAIHPSNFGAKETREVRATEDSLAA